MLNHQPSPKPARAPRRANKAAKGSVPCRKPRWSREPPPSAPPCWNRKGRWEEILETFQPEGRRGEGREGGGGGAGKTGRDSDPPPRTPGVSACRPALPVGSLRPLHHSPPAPPAVANARVASRHNRPTFADPPYVSAPAVRALLLPGGELPRRSLPHASAFRQAPHLALQLP